MRGFFGIGVEGISKEYNLGNLVRSAHSFGAHFFFAIHPYVEFRELRVSDTADSHDHMPFYEFDSVEDFILPKSCRLVAVELTEDSIELPSFRHPTQAAYVLGPEMGSVSPQMMEKADFTIKIPMKFCVNVGVAGAIVMYDRLMSVGRFPARPPKPGGPVEELPPLPTGHRRFVRTSQDA